MLGKQRGDWWGRVWVQEGRGVDEPSVIREANLRGQGHCSKDFRFHSEQNEPVDGGW